jgi:hypothetical protein
MNAFYVFTQVAQDAASQLDRALAAPTPDEVDVQDE